MFEGLPYGFFILLRLIVFGTTAYLAWISYRLNKYPWIWLFGFTAIIFNPLFPIHLGRDLWILVDILTAVFLIVSTLLFKIPKKF